MDISPEKNPSTKTTPFPSIMDDLSKILSAEGMIYASNGEAYRNMLFGRDSLEAADDLIEVQPTLAIHAMDNLARLQGRMYNEVTAEELGKIPHQHVDLNTSTSHMSHEQLDQVKNLSGKWGGGERGFTYYGSLDATPLYGRLMARYGLIHGLDFLEQEIPHRSGETMTRKESFTQALDWICNHIESSELSLLEFRRLSDDHIILQSWRDSASAYIHTNGKQANLNGFIAPLEVQSYAYDALLLGGRLLQRSYDEDAAHRYTHYAEVLRQQTIERFWIPDENRFALAIDRDEHWQPRAIKTPASSQGLLLDSRIFFDMDEDARKFYVEHIVKGLYQADFMTEVGIRCRANSAHNLLPFADYHGSWAVWPKETYDFTKGLRRHGFDVLASDLESRIITGTNVSGQNYELFYVNPQGEVDFDPKRLEPGIQADEVIVATNVPEKGQAWTISATYAAKRHARPNNSFAPDDWTSQIERSVFANLPPASPPRSGEEAIRKRQQSKRFAIDVEAGIVADRQWNPHWWK